jgi:hypothetical protein
LSPSTSLQSRCASKGQFLYIMISLSRFSTPRWHHHKLMNTPTTKNIRSILICELGMLIICHGKKLMFGNLDSLATHHINGSTKSTFSTWNLWNKDNSTLRKPSITSWVEVIAVWLVQVVEDLSL